MLNFYHIIIWTEGWLKLWKSEKSFVCDATTCVIDKSVWQESCTEVVSSCSSDLQMIVYICKFSTSDLLTAS